jgi:hypothetical protein
MKHFLRLVSCFLGTSAKIDTHNFIFYFSLMKQTLRQIVAILALGGIALSLVPNALAATYTELSAANELATAGYIVDKSANPADYRLGDTLKRSEATKVVGKGRGVLIEPVKTTGCTSRFTDVLPGTWECAVIEIAAKTGLTKVDAGEAFRPNSTLSKYEAMAFAFRSACTEVPTGTGPSEMAAIAADAGIITTAAGWNATAAATRGEFFKYVATAKVDSTCEPIEDEDVLCTLFPSLCDDEVIVPPTGGDVEVTLSNDTPDTRFVPDTAQNVVFAVYDFEGGSEDTVITSVKLNRIGVGSRNDFSGVYLRSDNIALTNERTVNSENIVEFGNLNLLVPAGETVSLEVVANMSATATANSQDGFSISSVSQIASNGSISGNFPVSGKLMTITEVGVGSLEITSTVTASDPTLGAVGAILATVKFENDDESNSDHRVRVVSMALEQMGTIDADSIDNLGFYDGSDKVASLQAVHNDDYILVFDSDFILNDGSSKSLDLRGDIVNGKAGDTIGFALNDNSDVVAIDVDSDIGASVDDQDDTSFGTNTYYIPGNDASVVLTLKAGDVTFSFNGPATKDIAW